MIFMPVFPSCIEFLGRVPETKSLGLDKLGVQVSKETGKIVVHPDESTSVPNIFAFGDIAEVGGISRTELMWLLDSDLDLGH